MSWGAVFVLAIGVYALKAAAPLLLAGRELPPWASEVAALLPCALLAGLVAVQTVGDESALVVDARLGGLVAAAVAVWLRAPFLVVIGVAMGAVALLRLAGMG